MLPEEFTRGSEKYEQVRRDGNWAIYHKFTPEYDRGYEIIQIKVEQPKVLPNGRELPLREVYPSPGEWGNTAWSSQYKEYGLSLYHKKRTHTR